MQQIIPILAFTVLTVGLITLVLAVKEFTIILGESADRRSSPTRIQDSVIHADEADPSSGQTPKDATKYP